ncbi:MAG: ABC transporter substrate-binding protein [Alphaproteobacteria bacterium]|nr:ABC transporter substrate-binding protein [Alphaproteobacteria bacterium]
MLRCWAASLVALGLASAVQAQELRLGVKLPLTTMDPHFYATFATASAHAAIWERLVELDEHGQPVPRLAESWRIVDPLTWEFTLRRGVRFHDGSLFTSQDVVWSFDRVFRIPRSPSSFSRYIAGVKVVPVDDTTLRLVTDVPKPLLLFDLPYVMIGSWRTPAEATTDDFNAGRHVNGTGPYRFAGWSPNEHLTLERHDGYWGGKADWARVEERTIADDGARTAALLAGDVQAINALPPTGVESLRGRPDIAIVAVPSTTTMVLVLDLVRAESPFVTAKDGSPLARNPLTDVRVRRALSLAIPREAIAERVMVGTAVPAAQLIAPGLHGASADLRPEPIDIGRAGALLREAGWGEGFRITLHVDANGFLRDPAVAQAIAQVWSRLGLAVEVQNLPTPVYLARSGRQELSAILAAQGGITANVPLRSLLATWDERRGNGMTNRMRYSNPIFDAALERAMAAMDARARLAAFDEANRLVAAELPVIPVFHAANVSAVRRGVRLTLWPDRRFNALMMSPTPP